MQNMAITANILCNFIGLLVFIDTNMAFLSNFAFVSVNLLIRLICLLLQSKCIDVHFFNQRFDGLMEVLLPVECRLVI